MSSVVYLFISFSFTSSSYPLLSLKQKIATEDELSFYLANETLRANPKSKNDKWIIF